MYKWVFAFLWATVQCRQPALDGHLGEFPGISLPRSHPFHPILLTPASLLAPGTPQGPGSPLERLRLQDSEGSMGAGPLGFSDCSQGMQKGSNPASIRMGFGADHTLPCRDLSQTPSPLGWEWDQFPC